MVRNLVRQYRLIILILIFNSDLNIWCPRCRLLKAVMIKLLISSVNFTSLEHLLIFINVNFNIY